MKYLKLFEGVNKEKIDPFDEENWDEEDITFEKGEWVIFNKLVYIVEDINVYNPMFPNEVSIEIRIPNIPKYLQNSTLIVRKKDLKKK